MDEKKDKKKDKRISRRGFLAGAVLGGAGVWAGGILPRHIYTGNKHIPPYLYEYYVDNYWFESADMFDSEVNPPLKGRQRADIAIIGGGYAGMSTAFNLAQRLPGKRIVLLEGARCGYGASGRNAGFAVVTIPGMDAIFDKEGPEAARKVFDVAQLGLDQIKTFVDDYGVDCDLELTGMTTAAADQSQMEDLLKKKERYGRMGIEIEQLDADAVRGRIHSERFIGGLHEPYHAVLDPAKLARGMKRVIEEQGVEVSERSKVLRIYPGSPVRIVTEFGEVAADKAVIALNGYAPQIGLFSDRIVSDTGHAAATEPLSEAQLESVGWANREGLIDRGENMCIRLTRDNRIVFSNLTVRLYYENAPSSGIYKPDIENKCRKFFTTFPQLEGVRVTHAWAGTGAVTRDQIPSVGRFGDSENIFQAVAFIGVGVTVCQLAGQVLADLMTGSESPLIRQHFVNKKMPYTGFDPIRSIAFSIFRRFFL